MTVIDFEQRRQQAADRGEQFRAGQISEDVFRASLAGLGLRKDDVAQAVRDNAPSPRRCSEAERFKASEAWLREFLASEGARVPIQES